MGEPSPSASSPKGSGTSFAERSPSEAWVWVPPIVTAVAFFFPRGAADGAEISAAFVGDASASAPR